MGTVLMSLLTGKQGGTALRDALEHVWLHGFEASRYWACCSQEPHIVLLLRSTSCFGSAPITQHTAQRGFHVCDLFACRCDGPVHVQGVFLELYERIYSGCIST